jgi:hypothetical protein
MPLIPESEEVNITFELLPDVILVGSAQLGPQGPQGEPGQWTALTQAEYDALNPPDPEMLYIIVS